MRAIERALDAEDPELARLMRTARATPSGEVPRIWWRLFWSTLALLVLGLLLRSATLLLAACLLIGALPLLVLVARSVAGWWRYGPRDDRTEKGA